ncbi:MAG: polysaccharide deacetylase family protein [Neorhizobium sp.]|nr:polysaccharide deacetylase family protein [Neorhizobium sp.]
MTPDQFIAILDAEAESGRSVRFWLRDDDAIEPTPALTRLTDLAGQSSVPITLAVIPRDTGAALATFLDERAQDCPGISIAVHGWSHQNHAGWVEKSQELGAHRPIRQVTDELREGFVKLRALHPTRFVPMLVPPWNRIATSVVKELAALGFTALSTFGPEATAPIAMLNTHVDIIDWRGTRGGRPVGTLLSETAQRIASTRGVSEATVGILTHHLVHDAAAWDFLDRLFALTSGHPGATWVGKDNKMAGSASF